MENATALAKRFREVVLDGQWIANTNFKDQLSNLSWQEATQQIGSLNTIAALTFHIHYYIDGILRFFETGVLDIRDQYSFDMPPIQSQADWDRLRNDLWTKAEAFANHVEGMSDETLANVFVKEQYGTYRRNIEGMIEHCYYHLGQITLLNKLRKEVVKIG